MTSGLDLIIEDPSLLDLATQDELDILYRAMRQELDAPTPWVPLHYQRPPEGEAGIDWDLWLLLAGRGTGKTDACADYVNRHVEGPACIPGPVPHRVGIAGPTLGDAAEACVTGETGLKAHNPTITGPTTRAGGTFIYWPNGAEAKLFGASTVEDEDRFRAGGNRCLFWFEELAAWRRLTECYDQAMMGLRSGPRPHAIGSTTPKNRPLIHYLASGKTDPEVVVLTRASTKDNPHLPDRRRALLLKKYGGTRLGKQELDAALLQDVEGALWQLDQIAKRRVPDHPDLTRIVVGVDPSGSNAEGSDEQGIVGVGCGLDGEGYVLADHSLSGTPAQWGRAAVQMSLDLDADLIVVESNFGGDMASSTIEQAAEGMGVAVKVEKVHASRGKQVRAQPVALLAETGRFHHVGVLEELEDQLTTWTPDSKWSPDRLDAMVFAATRALDLDKQAPRKLRFRSDAQLRKDVAA